MGLLKHFRSRSKPKEDHTSDTYIVRSRPGHNLAQQLPLGVIEIILSYVCPHTLDRTLLSCEESNFGNECMLCDMRDLASCLQVCKRWKKPAETLLYTSIRIDAVHYCGLEDELHDKRKKAAKPFRAKPYISPGEVPGVRLDLLCRTLRGSPELAKLTQYLKLPYMTRESAKANIARTVSALTNLRYVDLPEGFYEGDKSCLALRKELQAQCPMIAKMSYRKGAEAHVEWILQRHWQRMEILELNMIAIDADTLLLVLASLPALRDLTLSGMPWLDDSIFEQTTTHAALVSIETLKLEVMPNITAKGLQAYVQNAHTREMLCSLTLQDTGVALADLHGVLWKASSLQHLSIIETVSKPIVLSKDLPMLSSISLLTMNFEILDQEGQHGLQQPSDSFYTYLAMSLHASALPALTTLYVRDRTFPERLLSSPIAQSTMHGLSVPYMQQRFFSQPLEIFSKGADELNWAFTTISTEPRSLNRLSSAGGGRPSSAYSVTRELGPQWAQGGFGSDVRRSVIVGNGVGGYLAVPSEASRTGHPDSDATVGAHDGLDAPYLRPPPTMSSLTGSPKLNAKRGSKHDLWR